MIQNYILILTNMTQRKILQTSQPSILALKNIVNKVKDQLSMRNLTIAIRQHCLEEHQTHLKDNYLRFFLKCESQLERNTSAQWNKVIDQEIKRMVSSQKILLFMHLKTYRIRFAKIKSYSQLDESTKIEQKICEEFDQLKDMQISEEVRVKTKYFFKWCQFISEKNEIKKMKNKQIQDLKKAKIFNQYSSKFGSFMKWKQYVRRIKFAKSKAIELQNKTKAKKIQDIFTQIKEKIQIISIQKMLEQAVTNKLQSLELKSVFNKLKINKLKENSYVSKLNKKPNIWLYRFYSQLQKRSKVLQNKSSIYNRLQIENEYKKLCKLTCWKGLKMKVQETKSKINTIRLYSKTVGFNQFKKQAIFKKQARRKKKEFTKIYKTILLNSFIHAYKTTLEDKSQIKNQEKCVVKSLVKSYFNSFRTKAYQKKIVETKLNQKLDAVRSKLQSVKKLAFMHNLTGIKQSRVEFYNKRSSLRKRTAFKFFMFSFKTSQQWKKQQQQIRSFLLTKRNNMLIKLSFGGLKAYKKVKIGQYQTLTGIFSLFDLKIKSQVISCLKERNQTSKKLQKLIKASEFVTLKVSFITILNKMLSKKMKIKSFCTRKDTQLKRKLFDMLLKNSEHLHEATLQAHEFYKKMIKKEFLNNLSEQVQHASSKNTMLRKIQQNRKKTIYNRFKSKQQRTEIVQQSYLELSKIVKANRFYDFYNSSKELVDYRIQEQRKSIKVEKTIVRGYFKKMRTFLKDKKQKYVYEQQLSCHYASLISQVQLSLSIKALKAMLRQTQTSLNHRIQMLGALKKRQFVNLLKFNKKNIEIKSQNKILRFNEILSTLSSKCEINQKRMNLSNFFKFQRSKNMLITFKNNVITDIEQRKIKELHLKNYLYDSRLHQSKKNLISKIKKHYQMKQNSMILCNRIATIGFKAFMTGYLDKKSKQLQQLAALKHYASNVKRRGMRALKYSINMSLLKENRAKTENYSKILIEKSMDNARKKSKLMETIERYNMSRVSRVVR